MMFEHQKKEMHREPKFTYFEHKPDMLQMFLMFFQIMTKTEVVAMMPAPPSLSAAS